MPRQIGVEIEFYGLNVAETVRLVQGIYGGEVRDRQPSRAVIAQSDIGKITIELDAQMAQQLSSYARDHADNSVLRMVDQTGNELMRLSAVPVEIVFPPVDVADLSRVDAVIPALKKAGAKGTQDSPFYAFGVHLNISTDEKDVGYFRDHLIAFFLLQAWVAKQTRRDVSRLVSGYNKLYPHSFGVGLMKKDFSDLDALIDFYKKEIKDRNYALDMYPLWLHLREDCLSDAKADLVKARPTFHYRLPDCKLGEAGWNFTKEYDLWQFIDTLAADTEKLRAMADSYRDNIKSFTDPFDSKWLKILTTQWDYDHV